MTEWQPARIINGHNADSFGEVEGNLADKSIVRVRPCTTEYVGHALVSAHIAVGCLNTARWFVAHPDDTLRILGPSTEWLMCEHEILTD
jgi:hypothetical protein